MVHGSKPVSWTNIRDHCNGKTQKKRLEIWNENNAEMRQILLELEHLQNNEHITGRAELSNMDAQ